MQVRCGGVLGFIFVPAEYKYLLKKKYEPFILYWGIAD